MIKLNRVPSPEDNNNNQQRKSMLPVNLNDECADKEDITSNTFQAARTRDAVGTKAHSIKRTIMISNHQVKAIFDLNLDPIKIKLMHVESGEGWSLAKTNAVETEYRRFLVLMKMFPTEQTAPLVDVDTFWHYHILDTMKYAADCEQAFGYFLHHFPYVGMRGDDDQDARRLCSERMHALYEDTFGVSCAGAARQALARDAESAAAITAVIAYCGSPAANAAAYCGAPAAKAAYCGAPAANAAAYCGAPAANAAYCGAPAASAAYCGAPAAKAAYCGAPAASAAYCGAPVAKAAHYGVPAANAAYCGAPVANRNCSGVTTASSQCTKSPEFYNQRPVLAAA